MSAPDAKEVKVARSKKRSLEEDSEGEDDKQPKQARRDGARDGARDPASTSSSTSESAPSIQWKRHGNLEFSDQGEVRNAKSKTILKTHANQGVVCFNNPDGGTACLAPLICIAFHGNKPSDSSCVVHIDSDRCNNKSANLKWGTRSEANKSSKQTRLKRAVRQLSRDGTEIIAEFESTGAAAEHLHLHASNITQCCRKPGSTCGGFQWQYVDDDKKTVQDEEGEIWKEFPEQFNAPNYSVSSHGRVKNNKKGKLMTPSSKTDYQHVGFCNREKKKRTITVHRLVALAFLGNPPREDDTVDHKDGNKHNNHIENLRWLSTKANVTAAKGKPVSKLDSKDQLIETFASINEAARSIRTAKNERAASRNILRCLGRSTDTAYGFKWKLADA